MWTIQHMKCLSYTWTSISNSMIIKYIPTLQHPNYIKFEIKPNLVAHKFVDPSRGMCQFKHYLSTTKRYAKIRNWNNIRHPKTPYHFWILFYFHSLSHPLGNLHNEIAFFFILLLICMQNTSICIICTNTS